jgi:uncharacterized protein YggE
MTETLTVLQPDRVTIKEQILEEVPATGAQLTVTVKGASFFTGQSALKKAREVAQLVEALQSAGLTENCISVESIRLQTSSGAILKNSSASYSLKLDCKNIEQLGEILTAVTSAKNISLDALDWQYADLSELKTKWVAEVIALANARAKEAATALGVQINGVHDCQFKYLGLSTPQAGHEDSADFPGTMRRRESSFDIGMAMRQSDLKGIQVTVVYRISGQQQS